MTTHEILEKYLWKGFNHSTIYSILHHGISSFSLSIKDIVDEFISILIELAESSGTLCRFGNFIADISLILNMILGIAKENEKLRNILIEKAIKIIEIGFLVIDELRKDRLSCKAIDEGTNTISKILKEVDEILKYS
ncbi:hypothetical protein Igag_1673 [Ignisphaera aggregans DSM 17230]|uniref:Uncharacterized protein n=1 Tax=Ignisphaera aggregans (strain DSM 17230 / JCM 13409 / AQ1.S1) TaxID=583356 RepID=E0SRT9_IGNAA|nr:hypothetical protein Igag_1673 [Ignisphaera aggregans DSM 17230]